MAESVPALGEAAQEDSRGIETSARLRWSEDSLRAGGGIEAGECGATVHSESTANISRSVSVSQNHRQETRPDLPPGEPAAESESAGAARVPPDTKWPAKRLWKRRSLRELGNPFGIPTFPQPQQQQAFSGYISNGSTGSSRVTGASDLASISSVPLTQKTSALLVI